MERLTSLANAHAQALDRMQSLEAELSKAANQRLSVEEREKRRKEETDQVGHCDMTATDYVSHQIFGWLSTKQSLIICIVHNSEYAFFKYTKDT